ncbi:hypothetical protein [Sagittula sp. SSi028]|uniref:hypothetical protein n=1 Tax=Sagittula sp. SSi028 TaxID=3400636 RepID=UPI003AF69EC0
MAQDHYAEYRDESFLDHVGLSHLGASLKTFWPQRGPQWDALGTTFKGPVLVEAKAHTKEFLSPASQAGAASHAMIARAFGAMHDDLGLISPCDWTKAFYQYGNRLAHLWWLRNNGVDASLLFVSFVHDTEMRGPVLPETWHAMFAAANHALGLSSGMDLMKHVHHVTPDVRELYVA